jgi:D-alanine-D-alanine ligase
VTDVRVLHLAGSPTSALLADVSRLYAADCLDALGGLEGHEHHVAWIDPDGGWRFPADLSPSAVAAAPALDLPAALRHVVDLDVDVMVPQLFCLAGMTHYRALFDLLGVPYPGNRPDVMALGADKARAKAVVAAAGVAVPDGQVVGPGGRVTLDLPVVVKPVDADNSLGVTLVHDTADLAAAVTAACEHSDRALVETFVPLGREVRCAVLDVDGELVCLPLEEYAVDPETKPVRDHDDKLRRSDGGDLGLVAKDAAHAWIVTATDPVVPAVHEAAVRAYVALGCRSYGLFDFRIDPEGRPWFLEASLYCSYARTSVISVMARAAGIELPELFALGVDPLVARRPHPVTT